ncbi:MAG: hypothetical protein A2854_00630 [Parcubacteria group bacterium RIFCSPHIGHO2_01_FULL_56_18]|nr:MAG: hypothetical protein A2854_00630 [Parcubacteria group bacterium RIFCSPHIGHO2_01_FULL_56_18]
MFTYYRFSKLRIVLAAACFLSVVFAPWWVAALCALLLCLRFRAWEVIIAGILMDLYWMPFSVSFASFDSIPLATIVSIALVFGLEPLRRQLLVGPEII